MKQLLLILVGPPGSGKNFVGEIMKEEFEFEFCDTDNNLSPNLRQTLKHNRPITRAERLQSMELVTSTIRELKLTNNRLVIACMLATEQSRKMIKDNFPEAKFILIETTPELAMRRIEARHHFISKDIAIWAATRFQALKEEHEIIVNVEGKERIREQLILLLKRLEK